MTAKNNVKKTQTTKEEIEVVSQFVKARNDSNVSQRKLSETTGIAQSTIARIEKNVHSASLSTFIKMLNALGYHIDIKKNR